MESRHKVFSGNVGRDFRSNKRIAVAVNAVNFILLCSVLPRVTEYDVMLCCIICGDQKLLNTIVVSYIFLISHSTAGLERTDVQATFSVAK